MRFRGARMEKEENRPTSKCNQTAGNSVRDCGAQHDGSYRRKRERHDDEKRQEVPQPWKSFMWLAVHNRDSKS